MAKANSAPGRRLVNAELLHMARSNINIILPGFTIGSSKQLVVDMVSQVCRHMDTPLICFLIDTISALMDTHITFDPPWQPFKNCVSLASQYQATKTYANDDCEMIGIHMISCSIQVRTQAFAICMAGKCWQSLWLTASRSSLATHGLAAQSGLHCWCALPHTLRLSWRPDVAQP